MQGNILMDQLIFYSVKLLKQVGYKLKPFKIFKLSVIVAIAESGVFL